MDGNSIRTSPDSRSFGIDMNNLITAVSVACGHVSPYSVGTGSSAGISNQSDDNQSDKMND
jgi:hypothetical protein